MNNKVNFETSNKSFSEIIGNSKNYSVPKYQRDYSWDEEQWDELWQDILVIHNQVPEEREEHYMGYLVLQKKGINEFTIIDGQQRITTISLLILASLQILNSSEDEQDKQRIELIKHSYISTKSPSSLTERYKLELNRNNDEYYRNDLANLSPNPRKRSIKKSEHQMRKAKEFYEKELKKLTLDSSEMSQFIENVISNYLLFTVIVVGDDVNAYKIFETLNARGVQLSTPDLVKNHLFSIIDPYYENSQDIEYQEEQWAITLNNLGKEDFSKFLRCFWNSRNPIASKNNLFKKIKTRYTSKEHAVSLLKNLKETSSIYAALQEHNDEQWNNIDDADNKKHIKNCLLALDVFNMVQPYPVLLSAYFSYSENDFARICKWMQAFCIRYQAICGLSSTDAEKFYNRTAIHVNNRKSIMEIKEELRSMLPDDDTFKKNFSAKYLSTTQSPQKAYYLLASIENHINSNNQISLSGNYSIEHILPKSAKNDTYWREQFADQLEQYVTRLGNLTLLSKNSNRKADKDNFTEKKDIYRQSNLKLLEKICDYDQWNPDTVNDYQSFLAKKAVEIWKI